MVDIRYAENHVVGSPFKCKVGRELCHCSRLKVKVF